MGWIKSLFSVDSGQIIILAAVLCALGCAIAGLATAVSNRRLFLRVFGKAQEQQQVQERLDAILHTFEHHTAMEREVRDALAAVEQTSRGFFDTVDIEHYDAFPGQAGKFSFSLLMLNRNGSGVILTSLTSTQSSKVYVKRIEKGQSDIALSHEEEELLKKHARP
jgi:hypothetical protein